MTNNANPQTIQPTPSVEHLSELSANDLNDLCDATDAAISGGGGFGWVELPPRDVLERFWEGVIAMPSRKLIVARLDGTICGTCQLVKKPANNEAQAHCVQLLSHFVAPWARNHGLAKMLVEHAEEAARQDGFSIIDLDVRETLTRAIEIYETNGFKRIGEHPHYAVVDGKILKGFYYSKVINPDFLKS